MAKKPLSKMIVLPLFLASVTLLSAGVLTGVHLLTQPFIEKNIEMKQNEGYLKILEIDSFDEKKELELADNLKGAGVLLKQSFSQGANVVGVVYDANITGWDTDLKFQVGFKGDKYAGFNLISSKETPGIGADYLKLVDGRIRGVSVTTPVLVDDSSYTGVTAPVTGNALKSVLELCARDYAGAEEPEPEPTSVENLNKALGIETADSFELLEVSANLKTGGILLKYDVKAGADSVGVVYEAKVRGFAPDLHFLVGFNDGNYAGFHVLASRESAGYGADYLEKVSGWIVGQPATADVLNDESENAGVTVTVTALKKVLTLVAADYNEGRNG